MVTKAIGEYILNHTQFKADDISLLGKGATASVYKVKTADKPLPKGVE